MIKASIWVLETQYKLKPKHSIRTELQHLKTAQHEGNWAMGLVEYTYLLTTSLLFKTYTITATKSTKHITQTYRQVIQKTPLVLL
ncbi:MAG: hypothetical protein CM15mP23_04090 [Cryomorphaceae bacterium]|nr:MAG: hypothetical protein CM15mP23_04090 [Cryomorphaceae bacterium]